MSKKIHTTALGKPFDMSAFRAKNEKVRAVGNMNVNARGDILDSNNNVIENRNSIVNRMYEKTMQQGPKSKKPEAPPKPAKIQQDEVSQRELEDIDDDVPNPEKK
jgi:hypothetical protein